MSDGFRQPGDLNDQAQRAMDRLLGKSTTTGDNNVNSLDVLRQQALGRKPSPWGGTGDGPIVLPPVTDRPPERQPAPVNKGVMELNYGDPDFDAKLAQTNYSKLVLKGLPKELSPSPWVDDKSGKLFFWLKNQQNPDASDRNRHYFPANLKTIEIAQMQGNFYKPIMINADEMRISASQAYMKQQNSTGFASYRNATDVFSYAKNMSQVAGDALSFQEKILREGAASSPSNPYFHIYLSDVLVAEAVQPVIQDIANGKQAYFDNPYTRQKIDEAIKEVQAARLVTRQYGDIMKPPAYEMPLSPFSLNPQFYNPDYYWSGAAYQASIREVQLTLLKQAVVLGKLPIELPPALPPRP